MHRIAAGSSSCLPLPARHVPALRVSAVWTTAGMAVYSACQWAMVAVLAKFGTVEMVGAYALGVAVTTPVLMLAQLNLRALISTDTRGVYDFRDYRDLRLVMLTLAMASIALLAAPQGAGWPVIMLAGLAQAVEWHSDTYQGLLQREEYPRRVAWSLMLRAVLGLGAMVVGVLAAGSLTAGLAGLVAARLAVLALYDSNWAVRELRPVTPRGLLPALRSQQALLRAALPLGAVLVLGSLTVNVPRYFIASDLGQRELGIFSALASLATAGNLFVNAIGQAVTPRMARLHADGDAAGFRRLTLGLVAAGVGLGAAAAAVAAVAGGPILALAYGPEYASRAGLLILIMLASAAGFVASMLGYSITAARRFHAQVPLQIAVLAGTALAGWILIPQRGLAGAAMAMGAGALVQIAGEAWILVLALAGISREERRA